MVKVSDTQGFYLLNLGCAKNLVEGEHLAGMLLEQGYLAINDPYAASIIMVNTCGFLTSAIDENIDHILDLATHKTPDQKLVVVGCLVGRFGKKLARSLPEVDLFISPGEVHNLQALLENHSGTRIAMAPARGVLGFSTPRAVSTGPAWAYLRLSDGCSRACSFCAIPHIRGKLRSRTQDDIINEALYLADNGVLELNLVAQDVSAYGQDLGLERGLLSLLEKLEQIPAIKWIRMLYLYPDVLQRSFLDKINTFAKVLPYFDIPLQHISNKVLQAMGRKHNQMELLANLSLLREVLPQAIIRSTVLVGHPGEDESDFNQLFEFIDKFKFDRLGCFAFEPQRGTRSAYMPQVDKKIARSREKKIMTLQKKISRERTKALVGSEHEMLFLGAHPESELLGIGRLWSQAPEVDGEVIVVDGRGEPGTIVKARILNAHDYDVEAEII